MALGYHFFPMLGIKIHKLDYYLVVDVFTLKIAEVKRLSL